MIIIRLMGGLGNQMFQYALGTVLKEHYRTNDIDIYFDSSLYRVLCEHDGLEINSVFSIDYKEASDRKIKEVTGSRPVSKLWHIVPKPLKRTSLLHWENSIARSGNYVSQRRADLFIPQLFELDIKKDYYIDGAWENYLYYEKYEKSIRETFVFKNKLKKSVVHQYAGILDQNSVSLHVRRGDYIHHKSIKFDLCGVGYYKHATKLIEQHILDPHYFIFTDDPKYVHSNFAFLKRKTVVEGNSNFVDLQLMSICRNNIIANSTFSFWGAFLNKNKNKIVIAPEYLKIDNNKVLFPSSDKWIKLDNLKL